MKPFMIRASWLFLALTVAACSGGAGRRLPLQHDLGPIDIASEQRVQVRVDAPAWLWDERIRYRLLYRDPSAIRYYNLDRWEAPLPVLIEPYLAIPGQRSITLKIRLDRFEQQFVTPDHARLFIDMKIEALNGRDNRLLGRRSIVLSQDPVSPDAAGAIAGLAALTERARSEIHRWLKAL
ncbi:hypothetical protein Q9L42_013630 [Methylomarinum sp. Ch1-1]|uniref:ABC-type transport auxiliary lipoprotein component domain-containing protein n=1 Tax=Methylomarinum roseum TaxID=3067653 RepID=A0AAU7NQY8_9GAMM|nr:hypothetical protein [Methylomarinum sp. Ch1-1]MDP4520642.1 hypothetical protein [Methylomarinum sp. Ch1-1]